MKQWYVLQLVAGNEEKVKNEIERRIREKNLYDNFEEVLVPKVKKSEKEVEENSFLSNSGMFPGYILVKMKPSLELIHTIETIDRVVKFLGDSFPVPITEEEFKKITDRTTGEVVDKSFVSRSFELGMEVDVIAGPFSGFVGIINSIDDEKKKLMVMISIFGRSTPIEVSFDQIKN